MGKEFTVIDEKIQRWLKKQKMFFVSTAPLSDEGLVNCSPKGGDAFLVLGPTQIAYLDYGGSGIETVAHIKENGRITIMFCAFEGPPKIFRFYGRGEVLEPGNPEFETLEAQFPTHSTCRNIIRVKVSRIADSCGYAVPNYEYSGERSAMQNWLDGKTEEDLLAYRAKTNSESLDGLPGLDLP